MATRAQSLHDQGDCSPETCEFCRWEMEEERRPDNCWPYPPARYAALEGREVPAAVAVGGHDDRHTGTDAEALD